MKFLFSILLIFCSPQAFAQGLCAKLFKLAPPPPMSAEAQRAADAYERLIANPYLKPLLFALHNKYGNRGVPQQTLANLVEVESQLPEALKVSGFQHIESLQRHFKKRVDENMKRYRPPEFTTALNYEKAAIAFAKRIDPADLVRFDYQNRYWIKYNLISKDLVVLNRSGNVISFYKLDTRDDLNAFEYFLNNAPPQQQRFQGP